MKKTFFVSTPIFYANAAPHMGHAYAMVLADVLARYHGWLGEETYFLTGTDEHGLKNFQSAQKAGKDPQTFLDEQAEKFKHLAARLGTQPSVFYRTTDRERHWPGATRMWEQLASKGDIYKGTYEGLYCVGCESFKTEKELVDGKCPDHNTTPERISQENYFFRLSKYTEPIKKAIESDALKVTPESRKNEILSLLEEGLEDVSFSRPVKDLPWGIPVPGDPTHNMYVWCDALTNYISALGYGGSDTALLDKFWPGMHVIGKDILRFHAAFWPGMLLSTGLPLPKEILVHGLILSDGKKMSKTMGNVVDPIAFIDEFGTDAFRFYLIREINPFADGDFTREKFIESYNAYLANGIGNLFSRVMKMATTYLDAPVLYPARVVEVSGFKKLMDKHEIHSAIELVWQRITGLDLLIQEKQPFKMIKTDPEEAKRIVTHLVEELWIIADYLKPFLPDSAEKIEASLRAHVMPEPLFLRK